MELKPGAKLGPYEILSRIGAGGMGQVWKARDSRLDRVVAIKTAHAKFSERFEREARAVAALNHPHICTLYDIGPDYLVMEYVEGAEIRGPLPLDQALKYAIQLASALEAAHKKLITHRDLKPANILIAKSGVKVLDFGLAKTEQTKVTPASDEAETLTRALTQEGSIVGTLQYMAPEQLQAKPTDVRADIFSFGCVLYEIVTGKRAFDANNTASVIAAILERPAPTIEGVAPELLDWILQRCMAKDPDDRWQTARDLRAALENVGQTSITPAQVSSQPGKTNKAWMAAAAVFAVAAGALAYLHFREKLAPAPDPLQFRIHLPDKVSFTPTGAFTLSPNGRRIAFSAFGPDGPGVWIQDMDSDIARALPDAATGATAPPFFWSPDSRYVVFSGIRNKLRKADVERGGTDDICEKPGPPVGGDWNRDGVIIFGSTTTGLWRVPAGGGTAVPLTTPDVTRQEFQHELPVFLADGDHFLYFANSRDPAQSGEYVGSLSAPPNQKSKRIVVAQFAASLVRPDRNRLLYMHNQDLMVREFDPGSLELRGEPMILPVRVGATYQTPYLSVTKDLLVYRNSSGSRLSQFTWEDPQTGKLLGTVGEPGPIADLRISPDGSRVAYRRDSLDSKESDIWVLDLARGSSTRLTFGQSSFTSPVWSPDGNEIAFAEFRDGIFRILRKRANGAGDAQLMLQSSDSVSPADWSPNGNFLLYSVKHGQLSDLWILPPGKGAQPFAFANTPFDESDGRFSPDGNWIAYQSNETGQYQIYVRGFSGTPGAAGSGKWMISSAGGRLPQWRSDGKEILWIQGGGVELSAITVDVVTSNGFNAGLPRHRDAIPAAATAGTFSPDFKKDLLVIPESQADAQKGSQFFSVMVNWTSALKKQ